MPEILNASFSKEDIFHPLNLRIVIQKFYFWLSYTYIFELPFKFSMKQGEQNKKEGQRPFCRSSYRKLLIQEAVFG
jgi:hypothetical protein